MTHKLGTRETFSLDSTVPSTHGDGERPSVSSGDFAKLWHSEVPKVIQMHQEERLQVRKALGLG
jgi:hypothetical protein